MAEKIKVRVEGEDAVTPALKKVDRSLVKTDKTVGVLNRSFAALKKTVVSVGNSARAATAAIGTGAFVLATKAAMDFESAMSGVRAVTSGAEENFKLLSDTAKALGSTTKFSATEAAQGMEMLGRAGLSAKEVAEAIGPALTLAAAGSTDLATAADIATNVLGGFGQTASELGHIVDAIANTTASANTNVIELGEAMKYAAPAAKAVGVSVDVASAAIGVLADAGLKGSTAGTGLAGVMARLSDPTKEAKEAMDRLGFSVAKNRDGSLNLLGTLVDFAFQMSKVEDKTERLALANQIFGIEAGKAALVLADNVIRLIELSDSNAKAEGTAKKLADIMQDNLGGALTSLGSAWEGLMIEVIEPFLPLMKSVVEGVTAVIRKITEWHNNLGPLGPKLDIAALAIGGVLLVLGPMISLLAKVVTLIGGSKGLVAVLVLLKAALLPLTAIVAAFMAGWEIGKFLQTEEALKKIITAFLWLQDAIVGVIDVAKEMFISIIDWGKAAAQAIQDFFVNIFWSIKAY